jgi:RNA polymerase sigma factor (sigma-70 family)
VLGDAADLELLDRWGKGERDAGALLLERHFDALYAFLRRRAIGSVDDLMQQTLLACVEGRARFRGEASFRTYLLQIARYQLYAHYRRTKTIRTADWPDFVESDRDPSPTAKLVRKQDERLVLRALRKLPPIFQAVLKLNFFDGLTGPQIAEALSIPEATVRSRLRRALDRLRREASELAMDAESLRETASELEQWAARLDHLELQVSA